MPWKSASHKPHNTAAECSAPEAADHEHWVNSIWRCPESWCNKEWYVIQITQNNEYEWRKYTTYGYGRD